MDPGAGAGDFKGQISMKQRAEWIAAQKITQHAQKMEKKLDKELEKIDNMGEDDFMILRKKRLEALKKKQEMQQIWRQQGHGVYQEIGGQKEWFDESKKNERMVCHFYRSSTWRCEIVDKHLAALAPKHLETRFIKVDAEKCPFLVERLNIVLMPTIIMTKDNQAVDRIEGFDQLGGTDDFKTEIMEKRLAFCQTIDYDGDLSGGIQGRQFSMAKGAKNGGKSIKQSKKKFYESDDEYSSGSD